MRRAAAVLALAALLAAGSGRAAAGDSLYGRVTEVRSADIVLLDYGAGRYVVRIIGITPPRAPALAAQARDLVAKLVLGKNARIRLGSRLANGELVAKLQTDDPAIGIRDVGLELLRTGLAQRVSNARDYQLGYPYNELTTAQREAQAAKRGLWSATPPR